MLDWTDRHCRYFLRLLSSQTLLYTEMVTTGAIIHGKGDYLAYSEEEHPVALQLGGSDPAALAQCAGAPGRLVLVAHYEVLPGITWDAVIDLPERL